jgi:hypothetical protein
MVIGQTVTIPADRRLHLDFEVPAEIPAGDTVRVELIWSPQTKVAKIKDAQSLDAALERMWELTKDSPLTVAEFLQMRRQDRELEEQKFQRLFY